MHYLLICLDTLELRFHKYLARLVVRVPQLLFTNAKVRVLSLLCLAPYLLESP